MAKIYDLSVSLRPDHLENSELKLNPVSHEEAAGIFAKRYRVRVSDLPHAEAIYVYKTQPGLTLPVIAKYMRVPKENPALRESHDTYGKHLNQNLHTALEGIKSSLISRQSSGSGSSQRIRLI